MCFSIFYAQVLGIWLFIIALAALTQQTRFKKMLANSLEEPFLAWAGILLFGIGLIIVISHNIWVHAWPLVVTLVGWVFVIAGAMRLVWPKTFLQIAATFNARVGFAVLSWAWLIIGAYLIWMGFL